MKLKAKVIDGMIALYVGKWTHTEWMIQIDYKGQVKFVTYLGDDHISGDSLPCANVKQALKLGKQYEKDMKACLESGEEG